MLTGRTTQRSRPLENLFSGLKGTGLLFSENNQLLESEHNKYDHKMFQIDQSRQIVRRNDSKVKYQAY